MPLKPIHTETSSYTTVNKPLSSIAYSLLPTWKMECTIPNKNKVMYLKCIFKYVLPFD